MYEKIFTLGPNFRNEGIDDEHLQEYYQVEWYWAYADYRDNMELVKEMFRHIAQEVYGMTKFTAHCHTFDLEDEWQEIDYAETIKEKIDIDIFKDDEEKMMAVVKDHGVEMEVEWNRYRLIDNLWKIIRKDIAGPAFLINEPKFMSPLSKSKPDNPELTERFHIILAGSGYTELNDPTDQYQRFLEQQKARESGDDEAQMMDIDFVEMLEYGMPPTSGYGHSERLFWFFEGLTAREATLFPQMKHRYDENVKDIYPEFWELVPKKEESE
jgi:lysyl-tRNA synthetase class 2